MEQKLNIAEILKNKPRGTKLYSMIHGKCSFEAVTDEIFKINFCTLKFGLHSISRCQIIKWAYLSDILPKDIINNRFDKKKQRMVMRRKIGDIYKAKIDSYNSYYQHMKLLGEVDEALSLDEWEKKHRKWL